MVMIEKMTRIQILNEIKSKINNIYIDNGFKARVRIVNNNITLDIPNAKELQNAFNILSEVFKQYGLNPQTGELQ